MDDDEHEHDDEVAEDSLIIIHDDDDEDDDDARNGTVVVIMSTPEPFQTNAVSNASIINRCPFRLVRLAYDWGTTRTNRKRRTPKRRPFRPSVRPSECACGRRARVVIESSR